MKYLKSSTIICILFLMNVFSHVNAAEMTVINSDCAFYKANCENAPNAVQILGEIVEGDAEKFGNIIVSQPKITSVILRSEGGSVKEAMTIGRIVRKTYMETIAPEIRTDFTGKKIDYAICPDDKNSTSQKNSCVCASACFLIYASGIPRNNAYILLHRPYIKPEVNKNLTIENSIKISKQIQSDVAEFLNEMGLSNTYSEIMFSTPSNQAKVIPYLEMRDNIYGYPREVEEWLMAKCNTISINQRRKKFDEFSKEYLFAKNPYYDDTLKYANDKQVSNAFYKKFQDWNKEHDRKFDETSAQFFSDNIKSSLCEKRELEKAFLNQKQ